MTGTSSQVKQRKILVECIEQNGQREKLKPYVVNMAMNLWGHSWFYQRNAHINITPILGRNNKLIHVPGKIILKCFVKNSH